MHTQKHSNDEIVIFIKLSIINLPTLLIEHEVRFGCLLVFVTQRHNEYAGLFSLYIVAIDFMIQNTVAYLCCNFINK